MTNVAAQASVFCLSITCCYPCRDGRVLVVTYYVFETLKHIILSIEIIENSFSIRLIYSSKNNSLNKL
ncbi:hypothetical protein C0V77_15280 [Emticicia sp. TH156]|nr:hypothetical protein C0V77_15280 [Emticicia sp. TH156]